jgi:nitroreductase
MDFFEIIKKRHSYRGKFKDEPIPREDLVKIVQAGIQAPSGKNEQTTEFIIIDDPGLIKEIADIAQKPFIKTAQAVIACVVEPRPVFHNISFEVEDCSAAVENILLAITAMGYASVWIDGNIRLNGKSERISSLLQVPLPRYVRILLPVGIPVEECAQKEKKPFEARAWFDRYGARE